MLMDIIKLLALSAVSYLIYSYISALVGFVFFLFVGIYYIAKIYSRIDKFFGDLY